MPNVIGYSLFGYKHQHDNCYDFKSYLRYLGLDLKMKELIYPDWKIYIAMDEQTYESPYKPFFEYHQEAGKIDIEIVPPQPLCLMMLYRMKPIFKTDGSGFPYADRVICRDIDSLVTYRELQAVQYWINNGRIAHAITDSVSHTIPLMGGMVGFMSKELRERIGCTTFEEMIALAPGMDYSRKGSDQDFLNRTILPRVANSITEHFILGMYQSGRGDCHHHIQDVPVPIRAELKESNLLVNHIGQAGCIVDPVLKFFKQHLAPEMMDYYDEAEKLFPDVFYWQV